MTISAYNFGAALANQLHANALQQKQAAGGKGGLGGMVGEIAGETARRFAKAPLPGTAGNVPGSVTRPKLPARAATSPAGPQMGRTTLPASTQAGASLTHKQYGAGTVQSVTDGVATAQFPNNVTRQYRVSPAAQPSGPKPPAPVPPPAKPSPRVAPAAPAAAAPATPPRAPSMADRAFSAARTYGNMTGVAPTSRTGLAMAGVNPMLQSGAGMLDEQMGTNFAGQKPNQTDWTSRVGQAAFPTRKAQTYISQQLPGWLSQASQAAEQFMPQ
jgi:hypothetical protein